MKQVFIVEHNILVDEENDLYEMKTIGIFSSKRKAEEVVEIYKTLEGFRDYPDCFNIGTYELDRCYWEGGYFNPE